MKSIDKYACRQKLDVPRLFLSHYFSLLFAFVRLRLFFFLQAYSILFNRSLSLSLSLFSWTVCQIDFVDLFGHWDRSETHPAFLPTFSVKFIIHAYLFISRLTFHQFFFSRRIHLYSLYTYTYIYTYIFSCRFFNSSFLLQFSSARSV